VTLRPDAGSTVRVRPAERADLLAVTRIERASFPQPWPYDAFERYLDARGFLVAVDPDHDGGLAGPVVGYVVGDTVDNHGRRLGHVKNVAVDPDYRGDGVGTTLLERVLAAMDATSVKLEVRESNDGARALYRRFGFEPLRRVPRYYDDGEDAVVMLREA
jgi:ribosomal-protein-alanine N-acetyltransferase